MPNFMLRILYHNTHKKRKTKKRERKYRREAGVLRAWWTRAWWTRAAAAQPRGGGGALRGAFGKKQPGIDSNSSVRAEGSTFQGVYEEGTLCPSR